MIIGRVMSCDIVVLWCFDFFLLGVFFISCIKIFFVCGGWLGLKMK